jgi:hypothetical protein
LAMSFAVISRFEADAVNPDKAMLKLDMCVLLNQLI